MQVDVFYFCINFKYFLLLCFSSVQRQEKEVAEMKKQLASVVGDLDRIKNTVASAGVSGKRRNKAIPREISVKYFFSSCVAC